MKAKELKAMIVDVDDEVDCMVSVCFADNSRFCGVIRESRILTNPHVYDCGNGKPVLVLE